jgi:hypothetical protein
MDEGSIHKVLCRSEVVIVVLGIFFIPDSNAFDVSKKCCIHCVRRIFAILLCVYNKTASGMSPFL